MPRRVTTLMQHPQHQHISPSYPVVNRMANAVGRVKSHLITAFIETFAEGMGGSV
jgi:hypothetical protein